MTRVDHQKDPVHGRSCDAINVVKNTEVALIPIRDQLGASVRSIRLIGKEHFHVRRMVGGGEPRPN